MNPDVSVIIATFNRRAMVREAVLSVIAQEDVNAELIVVDDGSTDGTIEELQTLLAHSGGQLFSAKLLRTENRGVAAARNTGVAAASAPMLAFLDSDDLWLPRKLAWQLRFMRANPHCRISQTQEIWLRNGRRVNPARRHRKRAGDIFIESLSTCLISPSAVMLRADLFRAVGGFDESMLAAEDYDLWLRILAREDALLLDQALVIRRAGHPGQLSASVPALDRFRVLALTKLLLDESLKPERRRAVTQVLAEKCRIYGNGLKRRDHEAEASFFFGLAARAESERGLLPLDSNVKQALLATTRALVQRIPAQSGSDFVSSNDAA
jgi:glycosyltransferase involved in cell wall biosynthesis